MADDNAEKRSAFEPHPAPEYSGEKDRHREKQADGQAEEESDGNQMIGGVSQGRDDYRGGRAQGGAEAVDDKAAPVELFEYRIGQYHDQEQCGAGRAVDVPACKHGAQALLVDNHFPQQGKEDKDGCTKNQAADDAAAQGARRINQAEARAQVRLGPGGDLRIAAVESVKSAKKNIGGGDKGADPKIENKKGEGRAAQDNQAERDGRRGDKAEKEGYCWVVFQDITSVLRHGAARYCAAHFCYSAS